VQDSGGFSYSNPHILRPDQLFSVSLDRHISFIEKILISTVDKIEGLLYGSAVEALSTVGDSTMHAFLGQLEQDGIPMTPDRIDIIGIGSKLRQFFGDGSHTIIDQIYNSFTEKAAERGYVMSVPTVRGLSDIQKAEIMGRVLEKYGTDGRRS